MFALQLRALVNKQTKKEFKTTEQIQAYARRESPRLVPRVLTLQPVGNNRWQTSVLDSALLERRLAQTNNFFDSVLFKVLKRIKNIILLFYLDAAVLRGSISGETFF